MRPRDVPDGVPLIDVRTPAEFASVSVAGSVNVPLDLLRREPSRLAPSIPRDAVLICRSGQRARAAAALLPGARVLDGGILAWEDAGLPVRRGAPRWAMDRQVRFTAGGLVLLLVVASAFWPPLNWLVAAVGAGLVFSAVTDTCAMGALLSRLPHNRGPRVTVDDVLSRLPAPR